jgi:uncharacterized membrane protein YedE/YeeE
MKTKFLILLAGALFGSGLALSGMTDPTRVTGFLDLFGSWDPTLAFVMGGALLVFGGGYFLLRKSCDLPCDSSEPVSKRLLTGAAIFGIGWGLGGFCPGPAIANLGALRIEALVFVPAMAIGMILVQRLCKIDA